jgi:sigma-B regulation protein RsbU (phosphoserine phosphatase)
MDKPDSEHYEERIRRLQAVVDASVKVNSTLDLRELAEYVIEIATRLIDAKRGSLFLVDSEAGTLRSLVAQGIGEQALSLRIGEGIVGAVAATGEAVILNDPYSDPRFDSSVDVATGFRTSSLLTVPVRDRDGVLVAVLQLLNHRGSGFSDRDVEFLAELGVPCAIALTTARLHREIVARERFQEELRLAAEIQRTLAPRDRGTVPGLELETLSEPCLEVGGDYYDLIPASDGSRWWLVMADISGKGVSAGIIASNVQAYMWSRRNDRGPLHEVVAEGNDLLYRLTQGRKFATLVLAEWRRDANTLTWVNAGHPPILIGHGGELAAFEATGRPIGLLPDQSYESESLELDPGDFFVLYTDGVMEAGLATGQGEFGVEGMRRCLTTGDSPEQVVRSIADGLREHLGDVEPDDDVTILCARRE